MYPLPITRLDILPEVTIVIGTQRPVDGVIFFERQVPDGVHTTPAELEHRQSVGITIA